MVAYTLPPSFLKRQRTKNVAYPRQPLQGATRTTRVLQVVVLPTHLAPPLLPGSCASCSCYTRVLTCYCWSGCGHHLLPNKFILLRCTVLIVLWVAERVTAASVQPPVVLSICGSATASRPAQLLLLYRYMLVRIVDTCSRLQYSSWWHFGRSARQPA